MAKISTSFSLLAIGALSTVLVAASHASAETPSKPAFMAVSAVGNFEKPASSESAAVSTPQRVAAPQSAAATSSVAQKSGRVQHLWAQAQVQAQARSDRKKSDAIESTLDAWQKNAKNLWAWSSPRVTSFYSWATQKLGVGKGCTIPNLKIANSPHPAHINVNLQPVSGKHPTWVLPDGRMKTVAAR